MNLRRIFPESSSTNDATEVTAADGAQHVLGLGHRGRTLDVTRRRATRDRHELRPRSATTVSPMDAVAARPTPPRQRSTGAGPTRPPVSTRCHCMKGSMTHSRHGLVDRGPHRHHAVVDQQGESRRRATDARTDDLARHDGSCARHSNNASSTTNRTVARGFRARGGARRDQ